MVVTTGRMLGCSSGGVSCCSTRGPSGYCRCGRGVMADQEVTDCTPRLVVLIPDMQLDVCQAAASQLDATLAVINATLVESQVRGMLGRAFGA